MKRAVFPISNYIQEYSQESGPSVSYQNIVTSRIAVSGVGQVFLTVVTSRITVS